jgi:hypothetical protein
MKSIISILACSLIFAACSGDTQFSGWQTEEFDRIQLTESVTKTFILANPSGDNEQRIRAIAFDRGSNAAGHFRIDSVEVGNLEVDVNDIVVPPESPVKITVTYSPKNLETSLAGYGGWVTGEEEPWIPKHPDEVGKDLNKAEHAIHRAIMIAMYDHPQEGIFYVQLVGEAIEGPNGEEEFGGGLVSCEPGNGTACYTGGFAIDIPKLAPGGPKPLELTGPIKMSINGSSVKMFMDDFPYAIMHLRSEEIPQLPSGVTATLILSGGEGAEAQGTFDGSRITINDVSFRIRVTLGEVTAEQVLSGVSALIDFNVTNLQITTIAPYDQGAITMHMQTKLPQKPSGNELFDQFLSGAEIITIMEGELAF